MKSFVRESRLNFARKTSAEENLADMMRDALAWSDPKISNMWVNGKSIIKHDELFEANLLKFCVGNDLEQLHNQINDELSISSDDDEE